MIRRRFSGPPPRPKRRHRINHEIRSDYVRVIGADKNMIGILPMKEAMRMASAQGFDLVEVSPNADPPVCRILDYGKFLYEEKAKQNIAKKKQHSAAVRQMRLTLKISGHDFDTKIRKMREFLEAKDRVKVTVILRGREVVHKERGLDMIGRIEEALSDIAILENRPRLEGTSRLSWQVMFVPGRKKKPVKKDFSKKPKAQIAEGNKKTTGPDDSLATATTTGKEEEKE